VFFLVVALAFGFSSTFLVSLVAFLSSFLVAGALVASFLVGLTSLVFLVSTSLALISADSVLDLLLSAAAALFCFYHSANKLLYSLKAFWDDFQASFLATLMSFLLLLLSGVDNL